MIEDRFYYAMEILSHELRAVNAMKGEFVLFGSASLVIRGVLDRTPGDIDLFVSERVWGLLLPRPRWRVLTPAAGDPPILVAMSMHMPIHAFYDWRDKWLDIDVKKMLRLGKDRENVEEWDGDLWPCVPLYEAKRHKEEAIRWPENSKRALHLADIAMIEEALHGN